MRGVGGPLPPSGPSGHLPRERGRMQLTTVAGISASSPVHGGGVSEADGGGTACQPAHQLKAGKSQREVLVTASRPLASSNKRVVMRQPSPKRVPNQSDRAIGGLASWRVAALAAASLLSACTAPPAATGQPLRIVSLDYCADQFVLKFADPDAIVALSPDAAKPFSYLRAHAAGHATVRPSAEEVLALEPDLVVRSYGGGPALQAALERAGVRVHQIGWGDGFDAIRTNMRAAATAVGQPARGDAAVAAFDARLSAVVPAESVSALYVTAGGVTSGPDGMVGALFSAAGLSNFQTRPGWNPLPVERLALEQPRITATAFFDGAVRGQDFWSSARHPIVTRTVASRPQAELDGATVSCGGWFVADAVETLAAAGRAAP